MRRGLAKIELSAHSLLTACLLTSFICANSFAAPNDTQAGAPSSQETNATDLLRSNLQLQEQLHRVQLSIEENRQQADASAIQNAQSISGRLQALEQTLALERARDIDAVKNSTRMMWLVACTFGAVGLLAMLLMAYQWRTVSHLAEMVLPSAQMLPTAAGPAAAFGDDERRLLGNGSVQTATSQLLNAMGSLEKRIHDLEQTGSASRTGMPADVISSPLALASASNETNNVAAPSESASNGNRIRVLLGKGQSLLNLDKAEEALACFDEALTVDPAQTDALLKKAAALERLRKLPEALECYDRAIAADSSLIIAYLSKGGLYNRMEKFEEALGCYEKALKAQEKR
jgi:tetratricopeptide (TPR) repeat protein